MRSCESTGKPLLAGSLVGPGLQPADGRAALPGEAKQFLTAQYCAPFGSLYSIPKPTKSSGGFPGLQFMANSTIPSPRWALNVNGADAFFPTTWKAELTPRSIRPRSAEG